jgi:protein O-mannosyl-transferase
LFRVFMSSDASSESAASPLDRRSDGRGGWRRAFAALLLFVITLAVFSPVLGHRFIGTWDDPIAIVNNPDYNPPRWQNLIHYWTRPPAKGLFYVPVTYTLWGVVAFIAQHSNPRGAAFHPALFYALNWLAHATSAATVYLVLRRLVRLTWAAWVGAALFALHPIQVEAVASAWSLYTPLSAAFAFFAMWQYLCWSDRRRSDESKERAVAWRNYAPGCLGFALALLTKPTVAAVPLMLIAIELGLRGRRLREVIMPLAPWLCAAIVIVWFNQRVPATGRVYVPEAWLRPLVPLDAIGFYLDKVLLPVNLCMDYGRTPWLVAGRITFRATYVIAAILIVAAWVWRRRWPVLSTAFAIFVLALLPVSGIVPFTFQYFSTVADRYVYLAMLGPALAVGALLACFPNRALPAGALAVLIGLAVLSVIQLRHWQDDWKLAAYTVKINPRSMAAVGALQSLFAPSGPGERSGHALVAPARCTLDRPALLETGDRLARAGFHTEAAECYRRAMLEEPARNVH